MSGSSLGAEGTVSWAPVAPEPPLVMLAPARVAPPASLPQPIPAPVPPSELGLRIEALEREQRWSEVMSACDAVARQGNLPADVIDRYDLAKIRCDLQRRHSETAFRSRIARLSEADGRRVNSEVLARIGSHHVEAPNFSRLVARGCRAMDVAVDSPLFISLYAAQSTPQRRDLYRQQVAQLLASRSVATQADAETITSWVARIAHSTLGVPPAVTLLEMTAAAMGGLDEYSSFLTNGQLDDLYAQIEGNFVGLGVELKSAEDGLLVVHVIPGSPAHRVGLAAGDHLVGVGGRALAGMNVDEAAQLLQGPEGSVATLAVLRGSGPARAMTVRREHVEVPSVEDVRIIDPVAGVGLVKVTSFQKTTAADLEAALRRLDAAGMRSLVIDLRGNPGGLLSSAVDVADLFLERGLVVATRGRSQEEDFNYSARRPGTWKLPLVLVIDGDSASSSEIFAGAIRDHGRGTIVGTRSYGKGSIQGIFPLEVAGVGMRLTTAKFFSPKGLPYSRVGVEPDLQVHEVAKPLAPATGSALALAAPAAASDAFLDAALEVARRGQLRPVAKPAASRAALSR